MKRGDFAAHESRCPVTPASCSHAQCPWKGLRTEHAKHAEACVYINVLRPTIEEHESRYKHLMRAYLAKCEAFNNLLVRGHEAEATAAAVAAAAAPVPAAAATSTSTSSTTGKQQAACR